MRKGNRTTNLKSAVGNLGLVAELWAGSADIVFNLPHSALRLSAAIGDLADPGQMHAVGFSTFLSSLVLSWLS